MPTERFNYINYSDASKFEHTSDGKIQLKEYSDDLLLYVNLDTNEDATYAYGTSTATVGDTVSIENFGVFGQHAWIKNAGYIQYNSDNFDSLLSEGSIKFRMRPGFNNDPGYQEFNATTNPTISGDTNYFFKLYVEGTLFTGGDTAIFLVTGDTLLTSGDTNKISLTHTTSSHLIFSMYDNVGDTIIYEDLGIWSNHYDEWYAFEIDWNESIAQIFINGQLAALKQTGSSRASGTNLVFSSTSGNSYRFDEIIVYNEYQHTKNYTVESSALQQYPTDEPYIDVYFGDGFKEGEVKDLNLSCQKDCSFVVKIGNTWYYYYSGAWRVSDASYSQSSTPGEMETQFAALSFNEDAELIIRVYFHSDGATLVWLDTIEITVETGAAEPAIITGTVALSSPVNLSSNYNVVITTDQGSKEVDVSDGAGDSTAVTLDEIKTAIDNASVPGLAPASDDGSYHLVLQTTTTGDSASIKIESGTTNDALSLIWGYTATDEGAAAVGTTVDYSELFRYVRAKLGEPLIPAEITDEQLEDCLSDAVFQYNRWRNFKEELLYTTLSGNAKDGYDIPAVIGGEENIIEIILAPRFPFTYYAGRSDLMSNLYVQFLFQKYQAGFTQMLTDYWITISMEDDINIILGTQIKWEILNDKLFIHPEPDNMNIGIRYRGALSAAEIVTDYWIRRYTLAEAKVVLGNIRSTFKNGIPGGTENLQLNGEDLKQEGEQEKAALIEEMKKSSYPLFLEFF